MDVEGFDSEAIARCRFAESDETMTVAQHLVEKGDYSYGLFFAHLAVEQAAQGSVHRQTRAACSADSQFVEACQGGGPRLG